MAVPQSHVLQKELYEIPTDTLQNLFESIPRRVIDVLKPKATILTKKSKHYV
jgi:hypothetical protein